MVYALQVSSYLSDQATRQEHSTYRTTGLKNAQKEGQETSEKRFSSAETRPVVHISVSTMSFTNNAARNKTYRRIIMQFLV